MSKSGKNGPDLSTATLQVCTIKKYTLETFFECVSVQIVQYKHVGQH